MPKTLAQPPMAASAVAGAMAAVAATATAATAAAAAAATTARRLPLHVRFISDTM